MATQILRPNAAGDNDDWTLSPASGSTWDHLEETTSSGDTSYIKTTVATYYPYLRLSSTNSVGSQQSITTSLTEYSETISRPGGGSWSESDLANLKAGVKAVSLSDIYADVNLEAWPHSGATINSVAVHTEAISNRGTRIYRLWVVVDYTASGNQVTWSAKVPAEITYDAKWVAPDYAFRKRIVFDTPHGATDAGYTAEFSLKTGNRKIVASDGYYNEAVQASGGFQLEDYNGRTYYTYLSRVNHARTAVEARICYLDHATGEWSDPVMVATMNTYNDTHFFPVPTIDNDGYIHVFCGGHGTESGVGTKHYVSDSPEDISSWTYTQTILDDTTYPIAFTIPSTSSENPGRIYLFVRGGGTTLGEHLWSFSYSDNGGTSWSGRRTFLLDSSHTSSKNYCYGFRYDRDAKRLHIGFSFQATNIDPLGVWYAYSDLGETDGSSMTDEGFNVWRWADGTVAGRTDSASTAQTPITYDSGKAIILSSDVCGEAFIENLVLTNRDGTTPPQPVIFWEQKQSDVNYAYAFETNLCCAKWSASVGSSGSWNIYYPSEQVDRLLRVRRSGIGVMTDRDGTIHCYMPVHGKTWSHRIPDSDVDDTNVTPSTGSDNYACVDDGFAAMDTSDYLTFGTLTGAASFDSIDTVETGVTYEQVEVVAQMKAVTSGHAVYLYISDGTTDDEKTTDTISTSDWAEYKEVWASNPFTSSAWTEDDINDLEFGVKEKNGAYTLQVARVFLRARYRRSADDEMFSTEIHELTSTDGGATWNFAGERSQNSATGIPIMTQKHWANNDMVEIGWTSGYDLFYLTEPFYGQVLPSADDVRVYWGSQELHRIIDYANLDETTIRFAIPQALAADATTTTTPLYVYYGNTCETDRPLSDPNEVYTYFETFDDYDENSSINGQGGWTLNSGTALIWESPPGDDPVDNGHSNKIFAGGKCLDFTGLGNATKTIGSGLTNVYAEVAIWATINASNFFTLLDGSSNSWGAGFRLGNTGGYDDDGTMTASSLNCYNSSYHDYAAQVTSAGCSAWADGELMVEEASGISSVNTLKLDSGTGFFDYIRVYQKIRATTNATISSGFTDSTAILASYVGNVTPTATYLDSTHAKQNFVDKREVSKVEVSVTCTQASWTSGDYAELAFYISNEEEYDADDLDLSVTGAKVYWDGATSGSKKFIFDYDSADSINNADNNDSTYNLPTRGNHSFVVHPYSNTQGDSGTFTITSITYYYKIQDPSITLGTEEFRGALIDAAIQGTDSRTFSVDAKISGYLARLSSKIPTDYSYTFFGDQRIPVDHTQYASGSYRIPTNWSYTFTGSQRIPGEILKGLSGAHLVPVEHKQTIAPSAKIRADYAQYTRLTGRTPIDWGVLFSATQQTPVSHGQTTAWTPEIRIAHTGNVSLSALVRIAYAGLAAFRMSTPVEYAQSASLVIDLPAEYLAELEAGNIIRAEYLKAMEDIKQVRAEHGVERQISAKIPTDYGTTIEISEATPVEYGQGLTGSNQIRVGFKAHLSATMQVPTDYLVTMAAASGMIPAEYQKAIASAYQIPSDYGQTTALSSKLRIAHTGLSGFKMRVPMEFSVTMDAATGKIAVEHGITVTSTGLTPVEVLVTRSGSMRVPADFKQITTATARQAIEYLQTMEPFSGQTPVELSESLAAALQTPIENLFTLETSNRTPVEITSGVQLATALRIPLDFGQSVLATQQTPAEFAQSLLSNQVIKIDYGKGMTGSIEIDVEYGQSMTGTTEIPLSYLAGLMIAQEIRVDWTGRAAVLFAITNAAISQASLASAMVSVAGLTSGLLEIAKLNSVLLARTQATAGTVSAAKINDTEINGGA